MGARLIKRAVYTVAILGLCATAWSAAPWSAGRSHRTEPFDPGPLRLSEALSNPRAFAWPLTH
jgi:hypothetical protein